MLCPAVLLNITLLLLAEIYDCHSHTDTNVVIIPVDECLTWIKLTKMCCMKAKSKCLKSVWYPIRPVIHCSRYLLLYWHYTLILKMTFFSAARIFLLLYAASLCDLICSERGAMWFIYDYVIYYFSSFLGFQGWWKSRSVWCLVAAAVRGICRQKVPCVAPLLWVHWGTSPSYYTAEHLVLCLHLINQTASSLWGRWILNDEKRLLIILCNS